MEDLILAHPQLASFVVYKAERTGKTIGSGSYGIVEEVAIPGAVCAAKHIHSVLVANSGDFTEFVKECKLLSDLRHPHIVQFLGICVLQDSTRDTAIPALLMEKMTTSLHEFLEPHSDQPASPEPPKPFIPLSLKRSILHDVASGLTYLHEQSPPIIHRDLSARNVLLSSGMVAKIADLGMARIIESMGTAASMTKAPGASVYMPPEALEACPEDEDGPMEERNKKAKYNSSIDIFSFGVLSIFTLSQTFPCNVLPQAYERDCKLISRTELERREKYMKLVYKELEESHPLVQMIIHCLGFSSQRPTIHKVMSILKQVAELEEEKQQPTMNLMETDKLKVELKKTVEQQRKRILALTREKEELGSDLLMANTVIERLETIEKHSEKLKQIVVEQSQELAALKKEKNQLDGHLSPKHKKVSDLESENKHLKIYIKDQQRQLAMQKDDIEKLEAERQKLKMEIESRSTKVDTAEEVKMNASDITKNDSTENVLENDSPTELVELKGSNSSEDSTNNIIPIIIHKTHRDIPLPQPPQQAQQVPAPVSLKVPHNYINIMHRSAEQREKCVEYHDYVNLQDRELSSVTDGRSIFSSKLIPPTQPPPFGHDYVNVEDMPEEEYSTIQPVLALLKPPGKQKGPIPTPRLLIPNTKRISTSVSLDKQNFPAQIGEEIEPEETMREFLSLELYGSIHSIDRDDIEAEEHSLSFDPFLKCLHCNKNFKHGQIQQYREHVKECTTKICETI